MTKRKQAKSYQELTFLIVAVLMLFVLIAVIFWNFSFLAKNLNTALNPNALEQSAVAQFNIEEFKNLGLIKPSQ